MDPNKEPTVQGGKKQPPKQPSGAHKMYFTELADSYFVLQCWPMMDKISHHNMATIA